MPSSEPAISVGIDGSPASDAALDWAIDEAIMRRRPVRLVHVLDWPTQTGSTLSQAAERVVSDLRAEADQILHERHEFARSMASDVPVTTHMAGGNAPQRLIEESLQAELLVLGQRGLGGFTGLLLGSVSTQVSAHAQCPVLVVPPGMLATAGMTDKVVVGDDGSAGSHLAVEVAFEEAARRAVPLIVVLAWGNGLPTTTERPPRDDMAELAESLSPWRDKYPEVMVEERLMHAAPAPTLLNLVNSRSLLVVGSHGRGGFRGMLLGSVSQAMLHHAPCPVLIARQHAAAHSDDSDRT
ncbi:MAG: universal stress protein [Actinocatenispora sp.]